MKFTEANVKTFKAPAGKTDHIEFDESMPGFGLRVRKGGAKYYVAQYRIGKKSGRTTLGNASKVSLNDAKAHAKKVFDLVAAKINPATQRTKAAAKASQTFEKYIAAFQFDDDIETRKLGYVGSKRYIRATVTPSGNDAGNIFLAGVWVQGFPNSYPTANPPQ